MTREHDTLTPEELETVRAMTPEERINWLAGRKAIKRTRALDTTRGDGEVIERKAQSEENK